MQEKKIKSKTKTDKNNPPKRVNKMAISIYISIIATINRTNAQSKDKEQLNGAKTRPIIWQKYMLPTRSLHIQRHTQTESEGMEKVFCKWKSK